MSDTSISQSWRLSVSENFSSLTMILHEKKKKKYLGNTFSPNFKSYSFEKSKHNFWHINRRNDRLKFTD